MNVQAIYVEYNKHSMLESYIDMLIICNAWKR